MDVSRNDSPQVSYSIRVANAVSKCRNIGIAVPYVDIRGEGRPADVFDLSAVGVKQVCG